MKINNPHLFFFPPNSIKVRESQSTKDCIVLISKREREKVEYCGCGNFQPIIYPHQTLWERGRGQAWGRKFSTHLFLTFEEQIADYAHVGNFLETFITLALCFRARKFATQKRTNNFLSYCFVTSFFFSFCWILWPILLFTLLFTSFLSVFYITFWPAINVFILHYFWSTLI